MPARYFRAKIPQILIYKSDIQPFNAWHPLGKQTKRETSNVDTEQIKKHAREMQSPTSNGENREKAMLATERCICCKIIFFHARLLGSFKTRNCCKWHPNERYNSKIPAEDGNKRFELQAAANTRSMEMTRSGSDMLLLASWLLRFLWLYCGSVVTHCGFLDCWLHRGLLVFSLIISVPAKKITTTQQQ